MLCESVSTRVVLNVWDVISSLWMRDCLVANARRFYRKKQYKKTIILAYWYKYNHWDMRCHSAKARRTVSSLNCGK